VLNLKEKDILRRFY